MTIRDFLLVSTKINLKINFFIEKMTLFSIWNLQNK